MQHSFGVTHSHTKSSVCLDTFSIVMVLDYISNHYDIWKIASLYGVSDIAKSEVISATAKLQIYFTFVIDFSFIRNFLKESLIFLYSHFSIKFMNVENYKRESVDD